MWRKKGTFLRYTARLAQEKALFRAFLFRIFTLVQSYEGNDFEIYHYDMYRLKSPEEAYELGIEESFYNGVNLIEWPEKIGYLLPKNIWTVNIFTKDSARYFEVTVSDEEKKERLEKLGYGD